MWYNKDFSKRETVNVICNLYNFNFPWSGYHGCITNRVKPANSSTYEILVWQKGGSSYIVKCRGSSSLIAKVLDHFKYKGNNSGWVDWYLQYKEST